MFASTRWRPQPASGEGLKTGAPRSGAISRTLAEPVVQRARYAFGDSPHSVDTFGCGTPVMPMAAPIVVPGANGCRGWIGVMFADPPASAAGFVHSTSWPGAPVFPKMAFAGGVSP